ncbi:MAG: T9SS type A sorting domain-containing protein [Bacteroidota bacterium]
MKKYYILFLSAILTRVSAQIPVMGALTGSGNVCSAPAAAQSYSTSATNSPAYYTWSCFPSAGVVFGTPSNSVTTISFPNTSTNYTVFCTATNGNGTSASASSLAVNVFETPTVTFSGANSFCQGSSTNLSASPTIVSASSTLSYYWSPSIGLNSTTNYSVTANPNTNTTYTVLLTIGSCTNSVQLPVSVNPACTYVWPGDVNNDGVADNLDILELGLHFSQTGPSRSIFSNSWQAFYSNSWAGVLSNGKNMNYSDCNGDGSINVADTAAVFYNYGLLHSKPSVQTSANALLSVVPDQAFVNQGNWGTASIYLGNSTNNISTINGLAFSINFDPLLIDPNSFYIEYPSSFLNVSNQSLKFSKLDFNSGMLYTAITHTNNVNVSGNGKIAVLHYKINSTITSNGLLNIALLQANQSDASGTLASLTSGSASVDAISTTVGIKDVTENSSLAIYPNPTNQYVRVLSTYSIEKIEVMNVTGKLMLSETAAGNDHRVDVSSLADGVYFITVYGNDKIQRKKIVVQH